MVATWYHMMSHNVITAKQYVISRTSRGLSTQWFILLYVLIERKPWGRGSINHLLPLYTVRVWVCMYFRRLNKASSCTSHYVVVHQVYCIFACEKIKQQQQTKRLFPWPFSFFSIFFVSRSTKSPVTKTLQFCRWETRAIDSRAPKLERKNIESVVSVEG